MPRPPSYTQPGRDIFVELLHRWARPIFIVYIAVLIVPALLSQLQRPFAFWDDLTIPGKLYLGWAHEASGLPAAIKYYWFGESYVFRPVMLLFYNLFYLVFGGEFWILQLLKIAARAGYLYFTDRLLASLGFSPPPRLAVFVFLMFHPALTDMMLFGDDTWLALAIAAALAAIAQGGHWFDLAAISLRRYLLITALTIAALGSKEVGVVFALLVCMAAAWRTAPSGRWRLLPLWAVTGYAVWHLAWMISRGLRSNTPSGAASQKLEVLAAHWNYTVLPFPLHLSEILLPAVLIWGAVWFWRRSDADRRTLLVLIMLAAAGMLLMTSNVQQPAIRYVVPVVVLLAIPLASAVESLGRRAWPVAAAFAFLFPLVMAGNWYWLALRYEQTLYQFSQTITALERKAQEGLPLAISEDLPPETRYALAAYFERYAQQFFGASVALKPAGVKGLPAQAAAMASSRPPAQMRTEAGYSQRALAVESFPPEREGVLRTFTSFLVSIRRALGFHVLLHDLFFPESPEGILFYIHTFTPRPAAPTVQRFEVRPGDPFRVELPAGAPLTLADTVYSGRIKVESGGVLFGFTPAGADPVWETALSATPDFVPLPQAPSMPLPAARPILLTVRAPAGAVFSLEGLHAARVTALAPARRYGALVR